MKRFFDTDIWINRQWFIDLSPAEKSAWYYLLSTCDNVGVISPVRKLADIAIGEAIDWDSFPSKVNGNIKILDNGKWWLIDYCTFQHPDLSETSTSKPVKSYITLLKRHGLWEGYSKGMDTVSEEYKEQEQEREKVKVKDKEQEALPSEFTSLVDKVKNGKKCKEER